MTKELFLKLAKKIRCFNKKRYNFSLPKEEYKIRESMYSSFFYHLALNGNAICGENMTMGTRLSLETWGQTSHLNERYCKKCEKIKNNEKYL